jgi:hypothetical protein
MPHKDPKQIVCSDSPSEPTQRLILHLSHQPHDLIDIRTLMTRFQASAEDAQKALQHFEQQATVATGAPVATIQ